MSKGKLIVANWKMNFIYKDAFKFCKKISLTRKSIINKFVICPPLPLISKLSSVFKNIDFGAQDCHYEKFGAFTGDVSPYMLKDINCKYVIIGHSERRKKYFENSLILKKKLLTTLKNGLTPIYCIGEESSIRKKKKTKEHLFKQLSTTLPKNNKKRIIIAYEPVWAIGSGRTPKLDEVVEINLFIKQAIKKINSSYNKTEILYGGSTNENNASYFLKNENIDGLLVGGTSLNFKKFSLILNHKYV